jgi:hypothetical protein
MKRSGKFCGKFRNAFCEIGKAFHLYNKPEVNVKESQNLRSRA